MCAIRKDWIAGGSNRQCCLAGVIEEAVTVDDGTTGRGRPFVSTVSLKVILPLGTMPPTIWTVPVRAIDCPEVAGLGEAVIVNPGVTGSTGITVNVMLLSVAPLKFPEVMKGMSLLD